MSQWIYHILFRHQIGGLTQAFVLDTDEQYMTQQSLAQNNDLRNDKTEAAVAKRVDIYKHRTLPVMGHIDATGKLVVVHTAMFFLRLLNRRSFNNPCNTMAYASANCPPFEYLLTLTQLSLAVDQCTAKHRRGATRLCCCSRRAT